LPGKLAARGEAALAMARVAGAEFAQQRLQLQTEVAERFLLLAQRDADLRLLQRLRAVLAVAVPSVEARVRAGAEGQRALLQAQIGIDRVDAELAQLQGSRPALVASLRAAVGAGPGFADASPALPELQPLRQPEQDTIGEALLHNPGLQRQAREAEAALTALRVTEWQRVPEFTLSAMVMGTGIWTLGGAMSLPFLRDGAIDAAVAQAEASLRAAEAMRRQTGSEAVAQTIAELAGLQAIEQQSALLQQRLLPRLLQVADLLRASWIAGGGEFAACSEATAMAIDVERMLVRMRAEHGMGRARLQAALGQTMSRP
jgi:outer membrane protein TolC